MRILFRIMTLSILLFSFIACEDEEEAKEKSLEVTPVNLNGTWQLAEWNGQPLTEGTYCYITFARKDKTFKMYQKFDSMAAYFEHPIRKLAHFSEYACMGVLLYGVWRPWKERGWKLYLLIVCWVFVSAGADEFHQLFIPGRYGCFADVMLDTCGGAFGLLVCACAEKMVRRRKQKSGF